MPYAISVPIGGVKDKMPMNKKGDWHKWVTFAITVPIGIVLLFSLLANLIPTAQTAGNTLNKTSIPLGSLFASNGVVFIVIMAAALLIVVMGAMSYIKGGHKGYK